MRVVVRLKTLGQDPAVEDIPPDECDQKSVLDVVVEGIALAQALDRDPRGAAEPLGLVLVRRAEQPTKVVREMPFEVVAPNSGIVIMVASQTNSVLGSTKLYPSLFRRSSPATRLTNPPPDGQCTPASPFGARHKLSGKTPVVGHSGEDRSQSRCEATCQGIVSSFRLLVAECRAGLLSFRG